MIELALVRHAKSDWGDPTIDDHDRPLNPRGLHDAPMMAARLARSGYLPDAVLASTALRAKTTAQFFATEFGLTVTLQERLYGASARTLLAVAAESGFSSALLVAHDPGMSDLAQRLSGHIAHMPTCAVATFTWDEDDWAVVESVEPVAWTFDTPR